MFRPSNVRNKCFFYLPLFQNTRITASEYRIYLSSTEKMLLEKVQNVHAGNSAFSFAAGTQIRHICRLFKFRISKILPHLKVFSNIKYPAWISTSSCTLVYGSLVAYRLACTRNDALFRRAYATKIRIPQEAEVRWRHGRPRIVGKGVTPDTSSRSISFVGGILCCKKVGMRRELLRFDWENLRRLRL